MTNIIQKSIDTLELPKILAQLAECAVSRDAKRIAGELTPTADGFEARERMGETNAAWRAVSLRGGPPLSAVSDIGESLRRAAKGGTLSIPALMETSALLAAVRRLKDYKAEGGEPSVLDGYFHVLQPHRRVEEEITNAILNEEELADHASPELASIRRKIRSTSDKVREALRKIITSPSNAKLLQDPIITQRSGRFVVPVKAESKGAFPGLVHDVSSSGATFFIEPASVVTLNNEIRELMAKEHEEVERILAELSALVGSVADSVAASYQAYVHLDFTFAKAKLATRMRAHEPVLSEAFSLELKRARHPLLNRDTAVPITVRLGYIEGDTGYDTLIVTGPNTGGKTVTLKTVGLLSLMGACGLYIPAEEGSVLPIWKGVFADIGDEQSIEQSLSTFSSHMKNIVSIIAQAGEGALILFDELGAGTDPTEGAALAIAVILHARSLGACVCATTHYAELKEFALTTDGVENAGCEFDIETLKPTYRLLIGIPGKSNAFAISQRLGLDESIIAAAEGLIGAEERSFDRALGRIEQERRELERLREEQATLRAEAEEARGRAQKFKSDAEKERSRARDRANAEAKRIIDKARSETQSVLDELAALKRQLIERSAEADIADLAALKGDIRGRLNRAEEAFDMPIETPKPKKPKRPIVVGDTVRIVAAGTSGVVEAMSSGRLTVRAGAMTITVKADAVELTDDIKPERGYVGIPKSELGSRTVKQDVDLRGKAADEAMLELDQYLDAAVLSHLQNVTIIHGKGTGVLRSAVREHLKNDRRIKGFRDGKYGEGDIGVTVVEFKE